MYSKELITLCNSILKQGLDTFSLNMGIVSQVINDLYKIVAVQPVQQTFFPGETFLIQDTYCREVINTGKTMCITEYEGKPGLTAHPLYQQLPLEAYISTPIIKEGNVWGTLNFSSTYQGHRAFSNEDIVLIEHYAKQISDIL